MSGGAIAPDIKRKWYGLAQRHLRMATRLLRRGFADGATFHTYHAFECILSAHIAASGYDVPPQGWTKLNTPSGKTVKAYPSPGGGIQEKAAHKARLVFFDEVADRTKPYFATYSTLSRFLTVAARNDALYYDATSDLLPQQRYPPAQVTGLLPMVRRFAREVWREIR